MKSLESPGQKRKLSSPDGRSRWRPRSRGHEPPPLEPRRSAGARVSGAGFNAAALPSAALPLAGIGSAERVLCYALIPFMGTKEEETS